MKYYDGVSVRVAGESQAPHAPSSKRTSSVAESTWITRLGSLGGLTQYNVTGYSRPRALPLTITEHIVTYIQERE